MTAWLLIAVTFGVLYGLWLLFRFTFMLIECAHDHLRESNRRKGVGKHARGKVTFD